MPLYPQKVKIKTRFNFFGTFCIGNYKQQSLVAKQLQWFMLTNLFQLLALIFCLRSFSLVSFSTFSRLLSLLYLTSSLLPYDLSGRIGLTRRVVGASGSPLRVRYALSAVVWDEMAWSADMDTVMAPGGIEALVPSSGRKGTPR